MAISYPLTLPNISGQDSDFISMTWRRFEPNAMTVSPFTGIQQVQVSQGQWWEVEVNLYPMKRADYAIWQAWVLSLQNSFGTLLLGDPEATASQGALGGTPVVKTLASKGASTLDIKNASINITGWMKAGDFFQIGTGSTSRLYQLLEDADTDGSGDATLTFWPSLRVDAAVDTAITTSDAVGLFRLKPGTIDFIKRPLFTEISFTVIEALTGA